MEPSRARPAFVSPDAAAQDGLPRSGNPSISELFPETVGEDPPPGPSGFANRSPIDVPDDFPGVVPTFKTRRKAEALPSLRPAEGAKGFDPTWCRQLARADWHRGFRCGVVACLGAVVVLAVLSRLFVVASDFGWL